MMTTFHFLLMIDHIVVHMLKKITHLCEVHVYVQLDSVYVHV